MVKLSELTREKLADLAKKHNDREIAEMFGVVPQTIQRRRSGFGIKPFQPRGMARRIHIDPEELRELYQSKSMREIAEHYGCGETLIWARIKEHEIKFDGDPKNGHRRKPGFVYPEEHLKALRAAGRRRRGKFVGANNPNWKGGVSGSSHHGRSKADHIDWKRRVLERADNKCEECGVENGHHCTCCNQTVRIHVHHIKSYKDHPEIRYDVNNGQALCPTCHYQKHF